MDAFVTRQPRSKPSPSTRASEGDSQVDEPPTKKARTSDEHEEKSKHSGSVRPSSSGHDRKATKSQAKEDDEAVHDVADTTWHHPAIEDALPPIRSEEEAIAEYEAFKSSQNTRDAHDQGFLEPKWERGKSSIYVDAFNLALDTVLEDEFHLFDAKELAVFEAWRNIGYEAQYLYVRLFLRKTSAWHRHDRLAYYSDVADPETAICCLQETRSLPEANADQTDEFSDDANLETLHSEVDFTFADASEDHITSMEDAVPLLNLDELKALAKEAKVQGKNKADMAKALCKMSYQQAGLEAYGLRRSVSGDSTSSTDAARRGTSTPAQLRRQDSNRTQHFLDKILAITGPCVRLSPLIRRLFERVHLVFYRSTEWTEKSLTTIILAKIARRNFPDYLVCRTSNIFESRSHLLEFEAAVKLESEVDQILEFNGHPGPTGFAKILETFEKVHPRWQALIAKEILKERDVYELGEGGYLRRFTPTHSYTRIIHKATAVLGRQKDFEREHAVLTELLDQRLFHPARRGSWYQRKALLEEHYMHAFDTTHDSGTPARLKLRWKQIAADTCEAGLMDNDCHVIYHHDLQKRLIKLEKQLRISFSERHDFGHVRLKSPEEHTVEGIQLKREDPVGKNGRPASTKTIWLDELGEGEECSVEEMCLSSYREQGYKGYHAEGGIVRTLFAYLFYDILFLYIPNVFQTAYQTCPLDLHTDTFYPTRASEINHRLAEIANGGAEDIIRSVHDKEHERRTCVIGLNWDYDVEDLVELVSCFKGDALATICKVMAQEYRQRGGGIPDLVLWRTEPEKECMFAEVKSANDRLSDTQRLWIHVLTGAGVRVALCNAVAREVRMIA
ncbi:coiled-coil domain-containing protein MTMR15 [Plectosphaerella plurivora]|uniref:Fanconi-associated nuclease n=1 Tax=Plectosphaerella plurivora TaxID=936078 RepID=A0A9P8VED5_9PEZI|nr:coiled-coil domain-containing protein MTMR15 [Plectosphaerella plurivora]